MQVLESEATLPTKSRPDIPRPLESICMKCLEKKPDDRYESAHTLAQDLERFLHGELVTVRPADIGQRMRRWCRRAPALVAHLLGIVAILLTVQVTFLLIGTDVAYHVRHSGTLVAWMVTVVGLQQLVNRPRWNGVAAVGLVRGGRAVFDGPVVSGRTASRPTAHGIRAADRRQWFPIALALGGSHDLFGHFLLPRVATILSRANGQTPLLRDVCFGDFGLGRHRNSSGPQNFASQSTFRGEIAKSAIGRCRIRGLPLWHRSTGSHVQSDSYATLRCNVGIRLAPHRWHGPFFSVASNDSND